MAASAEKLMVHVGADVQGFSRGMNSATDIATKSAKIMVGAFVGVTTAAALIGSKFEKALMETATVANAFGKDLEALEKKARQLGETTAFTATEAAKGMYALASAGLDTTQIVGSVDAAMKFAGATASTMEQSTGLLAATMKQFGLDADQSRRITDTFAEAITSSQLTTERLTEAMKYAGTTGASLGWSLEETTAAVAQFVDMGLEGSQAGTNLRMAMIALTKGTKQARDALGEMGLKLSDVSPEAHSFGEILLTLGKNAITSEQAVKIFGARAALNMKQLSALAVQGGTDFDAFVKKLKDAQEGAGRSAEMYKRMMDTFWGDWKQLLSALEEAGLAFFDAFKVEIRKWMVDIKEVVKEVTRYIKEHEEVIRLVFESIGWVIFKIVRAIKILGDTYLNLISIFTDKPLTLEEQLKGIRGEVDKLNKDLLILRKRAADPDIAVPAWKRVQEEIKETGLKLEVLVKTREKLKTAITKSEDLKYEAVILKEVEKALENFIEDEVNLISLYEDFGEASTKLTKEELDEIEKRKKANNELDEWLRNMRESQDLFFIQRNENLVQNNKDTLNKMKKDYLDYEDDIVDGHYVALSNWNLFIEGIKEGYDDLLKKQIDWAAEGEKLFKDFTGNLTKAFSDSFVSILKGDFDNLGDIWDSFLNSMLKSFSDLLADMLVKWAVSGLGNILSKIAGGSGGGGGLVDIILDWFQHGTGIVGVPQTGIYGLHEGEIVLSKEQSDILRGKVGPGGNSNDNLGGVTGHKGGVPRELFGGPGLEDFFDLKDFLTGGMVGGFVGAIADALSYGIMRDMNLSGIWAELGGKLGKILGGILGIVNPVLGAMGAIAGSGIGSIVGDLLGDLFNVREVESLRDFLEDPKTGFGFFGGRGTFKDDFYDKIGTPEDPFGMNAMAASFGAQYGNFVERNKETFEELGYNVNQEMTEVAKGIARAAGLTEVEIDATFRGTTTSIQSDIEAFGAMVDAAVSEFGAKGAKAIDAFGLGVADFSLGAQAAINAMTGAMSATGDVADATKDLAESTKAAIDDAYDAIDRAIDKANDAANNANNAADAANNASGPGPHAGGGGNDYDPGEEGDGGNQGGSGDAGGGGGESDPGDTEGTGWHTGGKLGGLRSDEGFFLGKAGEEVVTEDNLALLAEIIAASKINAVTSERYPINITVNVAGQEFETEVREWADDVRVEAIRRGLTTERLYYP